ncbi:MAG: hypothetical protein ABW186_16485 [Rhodanobacteraceae bacterium]
MTEHAADSTAAMAAERSAEIIVAASERAEAAAHREKRRVVVFVMIVVIRRVAITEPAMEVHWGSSPIYRKYESKDISQRPIMQPLFPLSRKGEGNAEGEGEVLFG